MHRHRYLPTTAHPRDEGSSNCASLISNLHRSQTESNMDVACCTLVHQARPPWHSPFKAESMHHESAGSLQGGVRLKKHVRVHTMRTACRPYHQNNSSMHRHSAAHNVLSARGTGTTTQPCSSSESCDRCIPGRAPPLFALFSLYGIHWHTCSNLIPSGLDVLAPQ